MENNKTQTTKQAKKKSNAIKKIGKGIKDTFIEMSNSLAGWIDDTGTQFSGKKPTKQNSKSSSTTQNKTTASQTKNN